MAALLLVSVALTLTGQHLRGFRFDGIVRFLWPFLALAISIGISLAVIGWRRSPDQRDYLAAFCVALVGVGLFSSLFTATSRAVAATPVPNIRDVYVLSADDVSAGQWVDTNLPDNALFATNRLCSIITDRPPYCGSTVFTVSALGRRQALIEGASYGVSVNMAAEGDDFHWAVDRISNSAQFGTAPDARSASYLWNQGVRYYWVDKLVDHASSWEPYASPVFENERAIILELKEVPALN
jgi:hypothetical protein